MHYITRGTQTQNVFMDDRRIRLHTLTCVSMTVTGYWFWAMSSYSWHAAEREGAGDHAAQAQLPWIDCPLVPSKL